MSSFQLKSRVLRRCWPTALALWLCLPGLLWADSAAPPMMEVPGGMATVARLLGHVDRTPEGFARSVNRVLLETIRPDHDWRKHEDRAALAAGLATMAELVEAFGPQLEIEPGSVPGRRDFVRLAGICGYAVHRRQGRLVCTHRGGPDARLRRRTALALDWDVAGQAEALDAGRTVVFELRSGRAHAPLDFDHWTSITGQPVDGRTALDQLVRNQRLGLVLEGLQQVTAETRAFLHRDQLSWIYAEAPAPFYRYSAQLELRDGVLVIPGGSGAGPAWSALLGVPTDEPAPFLRALLTEDNARTAYLWHLLSTIPPPVLDQLVSAGLDQAPSWPERLDIMLARLGEEADRLAFHRPRAPGFGISDHEALELIFPAHPGRASAAEAPIAGMVRAIGFANGCSGPGPLEECPADLSLLLRAEERTPMALHTLDSLCITDPALVRRHLELVDRMDRRATARGERWPAENFQGGVNLLRILSQAGRVDQAFIEDRLRRWVDLHLDTDRPEEAGSSQLQWLAGLLADLPAAAGDTPGRGQREQAFIASLVRRRDPQVFTWRGLDYLGERGRDLAGVMARRMVEQQIPCPDQLIVIAHRFADLERACHGGDTERARHLAVDLGSRIAALPPVPDRGRLLKRLKAIAGDDTADRTRLVRNARLAARLMGPEIRPLLICPAYLEAMGETRHFLFADRGLVRRHSFHTSWGNSDRPVTPWRAATVVPGAHADDGTHFAGHLAGLPAAMAPLLTTATASTRLEPTWYENVVTSPWQRITPDLSRFVSALLEAGDTLIRNALLRDNDQALHALRLVIPASRLEREADRLAGEPEGSSLISPAERFTAGLAVTESGPLAAAIWGIPGDRLVDLDTARSALGEDWRQRLDQVGAPTPAINGRGRAWVGHWPSYEALVRNGPVERLRERQLIDLRLTVIDYLGRHGLPGEVGADLLDDLLLAVPRDLLPETPRDWEGFLRWTAEQNEDHFDERMRRCFASGRYFAQL
jgi:hypothetical protein